MKYNNSNDITTCGIVMIYNNSNDITNCGIVMVYINSNDMSLSKTLADMFQDKC